MAQVAVAWNLAQEGATRFQPNVTVLSSMDVAAPILVVGVTSLENLKDMIEVVHVILTDEDFHQCKIRLCPGGCFIGSAHTGPFDHNTSHWVGTVGDHCMTLSGKLTIRRLSFRPFQKTIICPRSMSVTNENAALPRMPYVRLGSSGLKVSKIILGTMQYGSKEWQEWVLDEEEAVKHIKFAYEAGIQSFDTADMYSNGLSEIILGKAIKQLQLPRDEIVVMTKVFNTVGFKYGTSMAELRDNPDQKGYVNQRGLSRKHILASIKASLERLQLDYVDLLQCHRFDEETPIEETMHALHDVVKAGYVRYIGMSSCWAWQFHAMQNYAITNNLTPFISMQNHHNIIYREEEREMFPTLKLFGVGAIPWSPLARGLVARPLREETKRGATDRMIGRYTSGSGTDEIINRVEEIAKKKGISMAQVAIAWTLAKEGITAPIVGTTSLENLQDIIGGVHVKLTEEEINYLEEPYKPQSVIGHT